MAFLNRQDTLSLDLHFLYLRIIMSRGSFTNTNSFPSITLQELITSLRDFDLALKMFFRD